jgi:hypothetical protein
MPDGSSRRYPPELRERAVRTYTAEPDTIRTSVVPADQPVIATANHPGQHQRVCTGEDAQVPFNAWDCLINGRSDLGIG